MQHYPQSGKSLQLPGIEKCGGADLPDVKRRAYYAFGEEGP
jgi:hypothetical protein